MSRRVLVTGGSGTLGSEIVPRLLQAGCKVRISTFYAVVNPDRLGNIPAEAGDRPF